jgi:hypothetical protein
MVGSNVLDVVLGLVFVYWFFSALCSACIEVIAAQKDARAAMLKASLNSLLGGLGDKILLHPLVAPTSSAQGLSRIAPDMFAHALMDAVTAAKAGKLPTRAEIQAGVDTIQSPAAKKLVDGLLEGAEGDMDAARARVAGWFDHAMDGVSASYRRQTKVWGMMVAAVMAVAFNVDTVHVFETLWQNPVLTARIADAATHLAQRPPAAADQAPDPDLTKRVEEAVQLEQKLQLPVGWSEVERKALMTPNGKWIALKLVGLLLSVAALAQGAPFWFDLLNRLVGLRKSADAPSK